jgi:HEAT repeat protein
MTTRKERRLEDVLGILGDTRQKPRTKDLTRLSSLSRSESGTFESWWRGVDAGRRRSIVRAMVELAEDSVDYDFRAVFLTGLRDEDPVVRLTSVRGLWEDESPSTARTLTGLLANDPSAAVRAEAANALGRFVLLMVHGRLPERHHESITEALKNTINNSSENDEVRARAIEAAGPLDLPWVARALQEAYAAKAPRLKVAALHAMGQSCDSTWLATLLKELASEDAELRYEAALACGALGDESAVQDLLPLALDEDDEVRGAAMSALGEIGGARAREALTLLLDSESEATRDAAAAALAAIDFEDDPLGFRVRG